VYTYRITAVVTAIQRYALFLRVVVFEPKPWYSSHTRAVKDRYYSWLMLYWTPHLTTTAIWAGRATAARPEST